MNARKFFRAFRYAFAGIKEAMREQNFRFHIVAAVSVILVGFYKGLTITQWCILLLVIGGMLCLEMVNSALERVVDLASPSLHPLAKAAKDLAAGAVLLFALVSVIIGVLIFFVA